MKITKLLVVVLIAALCDNVGASQLGGMPNDTKLMDQKLQLEGIGDTIRNIIGTIIGILGNNTTPIPTSPNNTSPAPSPEGGLVETAPSIAPQGEATNGTEAPQSGENIGVPSLAPEGAASNGTEAPLNGGIVGVAPSPLSGIIGVAPSPVQEGEATNGTEPPLSGGAIGVAPSVLPIGGGTEPPPSGGVIGVIPPPQSGEAPATNDIESSSVVNIRGPHVSTGTVFTTNNFGSEDGNNSESYMEP